MFSKEFAEVPIELGLLLLQLLGLSTEGLLQKLLRVLDELPRLVDDVLFMLRRSHRIGDRVHFAFDVGLLGREAGALLVALLHVLSLPHTCLIQSPRDLVELDLQGSLSLLQGLELLVDRRPHLVHVAQLALDAVAGLLQLALQVPLALARALRSALEANDSCLNLFGQQGEVALFHGSALAALGLRLVQISPHRLVRLQ
mmetsp:Transcript_117937/g.338224  ORF Transcript_117937/g.338224 Transcript_117937/m.338224 type:complete len:200 (+) Transcript_117937:312-911(+)